MPPTDASTDAGTAPTTELGTDTGPCSGPGSGPSSGSGASTDTEDTLDLRLPDELIALFTQEAGAPDGATGEATGIAAGDGMAGSTGVVKGGRRGMAETRFAAPADDDLLDRVGDWGPTDTPVGVFHLVPVRVERDLPLVTRWMNDPAVAAFWELSGPASVAEEHLRVQLDGDGRSVPCLGVLDGTPMSYWEIYRADLDLLARHYPARPHDTGIHLLIGGVANRGRGIGSTLLRAVADHVLDKRRSCTRVVAEPDLRNTPSVAAFLSAGFRLSAEVDLPDKRAALMVRDRALRDLL
ncbi:MULTISPECIES: GNAT family N-acetyltransferase [Streptomyces]|uniref:Lysine N-acyltransferase MbtK n=1 Tax=Streptomyces dengpaensis TaxID=2049881 RepID=A0ABM6SP67_9ACTN|nr:MULTISPECIES: GNAT family N-acetyltransferase [Streptomyces]AVH56089.1 N-acetyltransferase [Streptomyces dengpaensis]PIB06347.1 rhizobactin siderophore biosynthesis protein rhbD [Streptomyces sp. HG99]